MAITRKQKEEIVEKGKEDLRRSRVVLFADFKGTKVGDMRELRGKLYDLGMTFRVIKKRLLKLILEASGIEFDPTKLEGQIGVAFADSDFSEIVQPVYKFSKEHETFRIVGGVDVVKRESIPLETIRAIGELPPREVLLAQVVGSIAAPIRCFLYVLSEKAKK